MNILITGSTGFLGKHLCNKLRNLNYNITEVSSKTNDLTNYESVKSIPVLNYDLIFHLAAWTRAGSFCEKFQGEQWLINQQINTNILKWWKEYSPKSKLIAFGTSASYATSENLVEDNYMKGDPLEKFYAYAMTKRMLLVGLKSLHKQFGMNYLYVIPSTLYGPEYHIDGREMHFIYDIIRKIINSKNTGISVVLFGDGYQKREVIYIDDFIDALLFSTNQINNDIINIGSGTDYTIREFAKICCKVVGIDQNSISYDINEYVGLKSKILDISKLQKIYDLKSSQTTIETGVENTIKWFKTISQL
jgi:GDP-L-fucose synthase